MICEVDCCNSTDCPRDSRPRGLMFFKKIRTFKKNHRIMGVGRDLWGSSGPTLFLKQAPYSRLHRKMPRWALNTSREGDSTTSLGSLFQCSATLNSEVLPCVPVGTGTSCVSVSACHPLFYHCMPPKDSTPIHLAPSL